jgi:hypothetical protein
VRTPAVEKLADDSVDASACFSLKCTEPSDFGTRAKVSFAPGLEMLARSAPTGRLDGGSLMVPQSVPQHARPSPPHSVHFWFFASPQSRMGFDDPPVLAAAENAGATRMAQAKITPENQERWLVMFVPFSWTAADRRRVYRRCGKPGKTFPRSRGPPVTSTPTRRSMARAGAGIHVSSGSPTLADVTITANIDTSGSARNNAGGVSLTGGGARANLHDPPPPRRRVLLPGMGRPTTTRIANAASGRASRPRRPALR